LLVSSSGYYKWLSGYEVAKEKAEKEKALIKEIFKEDGGYGPERICGIIRQRGGSMGREKCARHMADMGLESIHNKKRSKSLTNSKNARGDGYPNILRYSEFPIVPRMGVCSDITYLRCGEGFEYLCIIKDIVSGEILGRHTAPRMTKELVINAFLGMMSRHGNELKKGFIFASDRGSQYTSKAFMSMVSMAGGRQSFSRVGMPGDNSWAESFFANMKKEIFHWHHYETREEIRTAVFEYIEIRYNRKRVQKRLGFISPSQYFERLQIQELSLVA
jgi:putative transposase